MHIYTYIYTYTISPLQIPHWGCNQQLFENIQEEKFQKVSKSNLNLLHTDSYLHSIQVVLGVISNLDMINSILDDAHWLYANTMLFCIQDQSLPRFCYPHGSGTSSLWMSRDYCIHKGAFCFSKVFCIFHIAFRKHLHQYLFSQQKEIQRGFPLLQKKVKIKNNFQHLFC